MITIGEPTPNGQTENTPVDNGREQPTLASISPDQSTDKPYVKPPKPAPTFTCAQSGEALAKDRVLRFVIGPENTLYPDFAEKLPGKEFFVNLYRPVMEAALKDNPFGADVVIPPNMMDQIEAGLRHQALSMLSMTKKAGQLLTGAEKTEGMLKSGKGSIYLTASPKDADTRMTLSFHAQSNNARIVDFFTSDELSKASGANKVYHAALGRGGTATKFFVHVKRMNLFRDQTQNEED
ncbi:MAG: hypothetical protein JWO78_2082 [Micavibrio sp.]|nr:hypothetical protein [Micavibrio sp.]